VTLLVCAAVEWTLMAHGKPTVIYGSNNDLYHFFLQLTYLHSGWGENGNAYNMPSWSVCSEVFVYAVFFVIATKYRRGYPVACFVLFLLGMGTESARFNNPIFNEFMARAMVGFALGSLLYLGVTKLEQAGHDVGLGVASFVALVVVCGMSFVVGYDGWIGKTPFNFTLVVFPLTVVSSLKLPPLAKLLSLRPFTFLGDISYAVYLVHVPVQMLTLSVTQAMHVTLPVNTNPFFYAYTATLIVVGAAAHWGLERPAQRWLRARWKARALLTAPATPPPTSRAAAA
jgi:peptidoglycan/LPS O-acetylase OafA/YrhL